MSEDFELSDSDHPLIPIVTPTVFPFDIVGMFCSNGISKTGVFLTLYNAVLAVNSGQGIVSVGRTVGLLRQRRRGLVSTQKEYLFCHTALLYYAQDILVKRKFCRSKSGMCCV